MAKRLKFPWSTEAGESKDKSKRKCTHRNFSTDDKTHDITPRAEKYVRSSVELENLMPKLNGKTSKVNVSPYSCFWLSSNQLYA